MADDGRRLAEFRYDAIRVFLEVDSADERFAGRGVVWNLERWQQL